MGAYNKIVYLKHTSKLVKPSQVFENEDLSFKKKCLFNYFERERVSISRGEGQRERGRERIPNISMLSTAPDLGLSLKNTRS